MAYVRDVTVKQEELNDLRALLADHATLFVWSLLPTRNGVGTTKATQKYDQITQEMESLNQSRMEILFESAALSTTLVSACLDRVRYSLFYKNQLYDSDEGYLHSSEIQTFTNTATSFLGLASALKIAGETHSTEKDQETIQRLEESWTWAAQDERRTRADMNSLLRTGKLLSAHNPERYYGAFWREPNDPLRSFGDHSVKLGDLFAQVAEKTYAHLENNVARVRMIDTALIPARIGDIPDWQRQRKVLNGEARRSSDIIPKMLDQSDQCYRRAKRFCVG